MWRSNIALEDLLLFSEQVHARMFELHNLAVSPLHSLTFAVGLFLIGVAARLWSHLIRIARALLSRLWIL